MSRDATVDAASLDRPADPTPVKREVKTRTIILVLGLCGTLVSLQQTLVLPLLPDFPSILNTTSENASWLVTITLLTAAVGTPIVSKLADMFGKRLMLIVCLSAVIAGSAIAAVSPSLPWVLTGRGLSGLGTCLIPVGISIMRDQLPADRVGSGVALMSATLGIGGAVGMPLAGVIYQELDWHALFLVSGGFAVIMLVAVVLVVPESSVRTRGSFDYLGAFLLSIALASFLLAVSKAGAWGWTNERTIALVVVALMVLALWLPWELRVSQPLVDIRTSTRRTVLLTNAASVVIGFAMFANFLTSAQQVQAPLQTGYGFGLTVIQTGLVLLPAGVLMVAMSPVSAALIRRYGGRLMLVIGGAVMAVGFVLRVFLHGSVTEVMVASGIASLGTALAFAAMPTLIMRSVPITETASANGLNTLLRAIGTSSASAVVAAMFSAHVMEVESSPVPTFAAYQVVFWMGTAAALLGATIAAFIRPPGRSAGERSAVKEEHSGAEFLVRGSIGDRADHPIRQGVITVLHPDGRHIDWSRTDNDGRYTLALPEPGTYLVVASADGWAPQSGIVTLESDQFPHFTMKRPLTLSGQVTDDGEPLGDVMLSLIKHSGEYVTTTHADFGGHYEVALPPPGRYVLTVVDMVTGRTRSRVVQVGATSATLDIDIVTWVPQQTVRR